MEIKFGPYDGTFYIIPTQTGCSLINDLFHPDSKRTLRFSWITDAHKVLTENRFQRTGIIGGFEKWERAW